MTATLSVLLNALLKRITSTSQTMFKYPKNLTAAGRSVRYILSEIYSYIAFVLYSPFLNRTLFIAVSCGLRNLYWPWLVSKINCSFCQFS